MASSIMTAGQTPSHQTTLPKTSAEDDSLAVPPHPLRVKPAGNAYTATNNIKLAAGFFERVPDELILQVLETLDAASLKRLGSTCKALYAFSRLEDLWKTLCIEYELPLSPFCVWHLVATTLILKRFVGISIILLSSGLLLGWRKERTRSECWITCP